MALILCEECKREISDRAISCPGCGAPVASNKLPPNPPKQKIAPVSIEEVFKYVNRQSIPGNVKTVNGIGFGFGGYVNIPGYSNIGFIKKFFCFLFIPIIPLGTYLVKDWDGSGGKFIGEITAEDAGRFVSVGKQAAFLMFGGLIKLIVFVVAISLVILVMSAIRR